MRSAHEFTLVASEAMSSRGTRALQWKGPRHSFYTTNMKTILQTRTRVGRLSRALEDILQAEEELLAHGAGVLVVLPAAELSELHKDHLDPEERVRVHSVDVRGARGGNHTTLEPDDIGGLGDDAGSAENFRGHAPCGAKHCPAAVDDLGIAEPVGVDEAARTLGIRQSQGVKAKVTCSRAMHIELLILFHSDALNSVYNG
jgi:hypothetical protein